MALKNYTLAIVWSLIILVLSTRATINLPQSWWDLYSPDKFGHAFVYGVQAWLLHKAFYHQRMDKAIFWALLISISYGILMEVVQYTFFPNRFFEVYDIIANISGSFLGAWVFTRWFRKTDI
jgi:VanZ family protein